MSPAPLPYVAVPESFRLPPGMNFGGTSGIAFNSKGHIFVLHRGPMPLMEFDADGNFIRGFGDGPPCRQCNGLPTTTRYKINVKKLTHRW